VLSNNSPAAIGTVTAHWHGMATGCATIVHCWQLLMLPSGMYLYVYIHPTNVHHQCRPEAGVSHSALLPPSLL